MTNVPNGLHGLLRCNQNIGDHKSNTISSLTGYKLLLLNKWRTSSAFLNIELFVDEMPFTFSFTSLSSICGDTEYHCKFTAGLRSYHDRPRQWFTFSKYPPHPLNFGTAGYGSSADVVDLLNSYSFLWYDTSLHHKKSDRIST